MIYNTYPFAYLNRIPDRFWYVIQSKTYNKDTKRRRGKGKNCGKYKPRKESVTSAVETYLTERSYIQVVEIDIQGAESAKRKERTAPLCSTPRRPKRKGVFMCGRRDRNELFIELR
ncbi:PREDICTED: uncharacterized protein LOC105152871 [Acromyrmex echinatior]|uniref:uncharacterized protein LOC105152871 n=1 Tax=Acromyrmex echinatior TaxID=103372 RepID=UPI00058109D5|nr:PREDICTED: uncharacterized protein LOC105152871 [Acromyrmex echinatior]